MNLLESNDYFLLDYYIAFEFYIYIRKYIRLLFQFFIKEFKFIKIY